VNFANGRWAATLVLLALGACGQGDGAPQSLNADPAAPPDSDTQQLRIGLANGAKILCSSVFVAGRERQHVLAEELQEAAAQGVSFTLTDDPVTVVASAAGQSATAVYRGPLGCTLTDADEISGLLAQFDPAGYPALAPVDPQADWPQGTRVNVPETLDSVDLAAVDAAITRAFAETDPDNPLRSRAVVVVHQGRIIAERYAAPFDAATPQLGWSMTKTVTGALTGLLVADGSLAVEQPAPVAEWQAESDPRRDITLEHLLRMSSGLAFSEVYDADSASDVVDMLFGAGKDDMGAFTANMALDHPPGTHWSYASGTSNLIARIHRQQFDSLQDYFIFPRERLFNPLGMASAVMEPDVSGTFVGSSYMYATPRDWARLGLLYLQDGIWNGQRLLPADWVKYSLTPAPAAGQGQYGAQIWLNHGAADDPADRPHPDLPAEMFYLSGFEGQNVVVVPSRQLVVVRMGLTRGAARPIWKLTRGILDAME